MKYTKKLLSLVLVLVLALALAVPGFAVEQTDSGTNDNTDENYTTGKITIANPATGETYDVYRLLDLESYNKPAGTYAYKVAEKWKGFFAQDSISGENGYVTIQNGYVTWKANMSTSESVQTFAQKALAYAKNAETTITPDCTGGTEYDNIPLGYYLVDSSLGSLCTLDTTNNVVNVYDKNSTPSLEKHVQEDSLANTAPGYGWGASATADIGQVVNFKLTVGTGSNSHYADDNGVDANYVITDTLVNGMTYKADSISISDWRMAPDTDGDGVADATEGYDYFATYNSESAILTITLYASKLAELGQGRSFDITYQATLDNDATIAGEGNINKATMTYHNQTTTEVKTTVYTYSIGGLAEGAPFQKVDGKDNTPLAGVKFVLMSGNKYATFDNGKLTGWDGTEEGEKSQLVTNEKGRIYAYGLDAGTYTLKETATLPGYNLLSTNINVVINDNGTVTYDYLGDEVPASGTIVVKNNSGTELPETGGMGTTIFYTLGGVLVVGAAILLVTKKRVHDVEG